VLIAAVLAITEVGPGELSLDHALGQERTGLGWTLAAAAIGAAGAVGAHQLAAAHPTPPAPSQAAPSDGSSAAETDASAPQAQEAGAPQ
jgi:putative oxidoreductase